jgi:serine/threonine-protein kinase
MHRSSSFDESRFVPGTVLEGRYRIVGLLGRGGMGEVYRADDLKLGQTVALKFLPEGLEQDQSRLTRFFNEVRTARQVTHANVCRVYDTGEMEGKHFLSMEYVDGEDLASLLRRIGRLSKEKAVQIARQLCAGLAAAHDQGILHRDLKPANVMLDGRGRVKITDFGLAGLAESFEGGDIRAGTPTYMAPEQLAGREVTARSDIFSLGLVLYELFTGRKAYEAKTTAELQQMHETTPTNPSSFVESFDPSVERVLQRCLEREPRQRPASALAVAAALPGGDPLAAALAAGETPSPEMVAASGGEGGLAPWVAVLCLAGAIFGLIAAAVLWERDYLPGMIPLDKPPQALAVEARQIIRETGHEGRATDSAYGFRREEDYFEFVEENDRSPERWSGLDAVRPVPLYFWYRQSPRHLVPSHYFSAAHPLDVTFEDPPSLVSGMAGLRLDPDGRLLELLIVPPQQDASEGPWPVPEWSRLFEQAGLELASFEAVCPQWNPLVDCDSRGAWLGTYPGQPDVPIRVETGGYHGKPIYFSIIAPWTKPSRMEAEGMGTGQSIGNAMMLVVLFGLLGGGTLLARRNLRLGRGDRRGAFRIALYLFTMQMLWWGIAGDHVPGFAEVGMFLQHLGWCLFVAGAVWVFYIALEPHVRRLWPDLIISWTRLLAGRFRDPLVGRAILVGAVSSAGLMLVLFLITRVRLWMGGPTVRPDFRPRWFEGMRQTVGAYFDDLSSPLWISISLLCFLLLLRVLLRREWAAVAAFLAIFAVAMALGRPEGISLVIGLMFGLAFWGISVFVLIRFGLLALVIQWSFFFIFNDLPLTNDLSTWYAGKSIVGLALLAALTCYGFWISLAGRPLIAHDLLEEPAQ